MRGGRVGRAGGGGRVGRAMCPHAPVVIRYNLGGEAGHRTHIMTSLAPPLPSPPLPSPGGRVPTYEEVVIDLEQSSASESEDLHEEFERSYNFRFEEPGGNLIQRYPRTVGGSVRKEDDSRKRKRQERAQRKEQVS